MNLRLKFAVICKNFVGNLQYVSEYDYFLTHDAGRWLVVRLAAPPAPVMLSVDNLFLGLVL